MAKKTVHGHTSKSGSHGVPKKYETVYQDFLSNPKPFDLRNEMAMLRTLYIELREYLDSRSYDKLQEIEDAVLDDLHPKLDGEPEVVQEILTLMGQSIRATLQDQMDITWSASKDNVRELSDLLEKISRVGERMKKIQEGAKLEISLDVNLITKLLTMVVLPEVPEPDRRARIMEKAALLSVSSVGDSNYDPMPMTRPMPEEIPAIFDVVPDEDEDPFEDSYYNREDITQEEGKDDDSWDGF